MNNNILPGDIEAGVVGLGLMGSSIVVSLLIAGHNVKAIAPLAEDMYLAPERISSHLAHCEKTGLLSKPVHAYLAQLSLSEDYTELINCKLVLECVIEIQEIKAAVYKKIEAVVGPDCIIGSNTSAIPISELQKLIDLPARFLGIHWAEPSYLTRFMEITCGDKTDNRNAEQIFQLAHHWGKEPTLLRKDIRGFVTNRLMYAVYREGFNLVEKGEATLEDVDKAFRYDAGSWMTLMGIFRRMDFLGLKDYGEMFKNIFPSLCNDDQVPALMQQMVDKNLRGTRSSKGLYNYSSEEARKLEEAYALFNEEIYQLAAMYPANGERAISAATEKETTMAE
jgi:3-hydroxybutyryl-CoA dehydrogenase